jgi:hypothetical protein
LIETYNSMPHNPVYNQPEKKLDHMAVIPH